jgi:PAS domain S-box-containing protein
MDSRDGSTIDLRVIADAMPHIVWTHDLAGVPTYFNRRWTEYTGLDLQETVRVGAQSLVHPDDIPAVTRLFAESHERGVEVEVSYRLRRSDGQYRWHVGRVAPVTSSAGEPLLFVGTATDVDEARRVADEQHFLTEAGRVLGTSLDVGTTLKDVASLVVPHLADWCAIDLLTARGDIERAAVAHVDPKKVDLAWEIWRRLPARPDDPRGLAAVLRTREAEHLEDIPDELLVQAIPDPELLRIFRELGLRSSMCVPLVARDKVLGAVTLVSAESGRRFVKRDLRFAEDFARRIAVAVDNARLYQASNDARLAAEALAAEVVEQSKAVEAALRAAQAERDRAIAERESAER